MLNPSLVEPRKTLGQQIEELHASSASDTDQTVRDTTNEMGKKYMESLWSLVQQHIHLTKPYYILEIMKPDSHLTNTVKLLHVARWTRPVPEWGLALYRVDNSLGEVFYEWGLPHVNEAEFMMHDPLGWDPKMIKDIQDFREGKLA